MHMFAALFILVVMSLLFITGKTSLGEGLLWALALSVPLVLITLYLKRRKKNKSEELKKEVELQETADRHSAHPNEETL